MTVENIQNKMPPLQMGSTTQYPFTFAVLLQDPTEEEALKAIKARVLLADGSEVELVYETDYTVELNTNRIGGTLTVNDIRTDEDYLTIYRQYEQTQEVDYRDFNSAPAETFEQCFDKLTMLSQQQQEQIDRSIKLPLYSSATSLTLPIPDAGKTLKWNEEETGLINSDVSIDEIDDFVETANQAAETANQKANEAIIAAETAVSNVEASTKLLNETLLNVENLTNPVFCANSGNTDENGNADLLYLSNMGENEIAWQNPIVSSANEYGNITWDRGNFLFLVDGSTGLNTIDGGTYNFTWEFPSDKRIFVNGFKVFWGCQDAVSGAPELANLFLYKSGELVKTIILTRNFVYGWIEDTFEKTECDKIVFQFDGYWGTTVPTRIGEIQLLGTEIITVSTSNSVHFKVGGNYPNLIATSTEKTFEKSYLAPLTAETDGTFNVFLSENETYALTNTIYRQKTEPNGAENDVWLNTSIQPYKANKFDGTQWVDFKDVPIGSMTVEGGVISSVSTFEYNLIIEKEEILSSLIPDVTTEVTRANTGFTSEKVQWLYVLGSSRGYDLVVFVNGVEIHRTLIGGTTAYPITTTSWFLLGKDDVVTVSAGAGATVTLKTFNCKGL